MKFLIKPNFEKPDACKCAMLAADTLIEIAARLGEPVDILFEEGDRDYIGGRGDIVFGPPEAVLGACDVVISVGGDGTIMRIAESAARAAKPILGVNAGHVGFLTQAEMHELGELERLFTGNYRILNRMMLEARVENDGKTGVYTALNDVVIRHGDSDRIVAIEVCQDEKLIASHRADGVIFSTPTGSTAYSISAGGPVVSPELEIILMTAICPHSAFSCSLVLPPNLEYTVREKLSGNQSGMYVSVDGLRVDKLKPEGSVTVSRSGTVAKFIDLGLREFFSNLNQKLNWRGSAHEG